MATSTLGSKKASNISRTENVALKLPKICLTKEYFGQFKGYFGQFKGYIFAVRVIFAFFCVLGVVGHRGFTIVLIVEALEFSELKTPLVYTFFPSNFLLGTDSVPSRQLPNNCLLNPPKDPPVQKTLRIVNLLSVVNSLRR